MEGAAARVASTVVREAGRRVTKQALEVSEAAAQRVAELLSQRDKPFLKLSVKTRGCSGLSYSMSYAGACDAPPNHAERPCVHRGSWQPPLERWLHSAQVPLLTPSCLPVQTRRASLTSWSPAPAA